MEFEKLLDKYAEVTIKVGLNLQKGQRLIITNPFSSGVPMELAPLVRLLVEKAYQNGVEYVEVFWEDPEINLARYKYATKESFKEQPKWRIDPVMEILEKGDAFLGIYAVDPDALIEQDPEKIAIAQQTSALLVQPIIEQLTNNVTNWCLISAPVDGWDDKVFADIPKKERKAKFWETIFQLCRITEKDPIAAWKKHITELVKRADYLNKKQYSALKFTGPGTDLTIGLPKGHLWASGQLTSKNNITCTVNIPTEEVFTLPHKDKVNGVVTSTKPLFWGGMIVEGIKFTIKDGVITEAKATKGEEFLNQLISFDEGARRFGEVALVPESSPIAKSKLLFYNILYDENASNHLALGSAYKFSMVDGDSLSDEDFIRAGANKSAIHIDFMIGSAEVNVDGITQDGTEEPIMRNGEWAFNI